jgi:hypothetical protein
MIDYEGGLYLIAFAAYFALGMYLLFEAIGITRD